MSEQPELAELRRRLQRLEDREAIRDSYAHYAWLIDSGAWERVAAEIFTADGVLVLGEGMVYEGRAAIHDAYERMVPRLEATGHYFTNILVEVGGDRLATAQAYFQSYHWTREMSGDEHRPSEFVGVGVYHDQLVEEEAGWRISHRRRGLLGPGPIGHGALPASLTAGMRGWGRT